MGRSERGLIARKNNAGWKPAVQLEARAPEFSRRRFLQGTALGASALLTSGFNWRDKIPGFPHIKRKSTNLKVIALGMDGVDPVLLRRFVAEGELPTFARLIASGHFSELQTTMPPHSPVAWSSFITGTNPGGHGIYDFVHRDPTKFIPYMSTSRAFDGKRKLTLGDWSVPLDSGRMELMRKGTAFWSVLDENDIFASLYALPANFPVVEGHSNTVSGMGTPDLLGTYGTFTYFSEVDVPGSENFAGGRVIKVSVNNHSVTTKLPGPKNPFAVKSKSAELDLTFQRDPLEQVVRIKIDGHDLVLKKGEWSEWLPIKFEFVPMFSSTAGMVRFYVKELHPTLGIYMSPINIDPLEPSLPICTPHNYSRELTQAVGRFYTQGFPSDTKALSAGVLSDEEYLEQAKWVLEESLRIFNHQFKDFRDGFFFFYFSSTDQNSHMLYRTMDPTHPLYRPDAGPEVKNGLRYFYKRMDEVLAKVMEKVDSQTMLVVLSDHGFAPFTREFHTSSWLLENGFTRLTDSSRRAQGEFYRYVDWAGTKAYALGLNGIYINVKGREPNGTVPPEKVDKVRNEIVEKLSGVVDPLNGSPVITQVYYPEKIYSGPFVNMAPDLVVGFQRGYRISDEAVLGKFPQGIVGNRTDKWSADHCLDPAVVPGILLTNRSCSVPDPGIWDIAPSILNAFGLKPPPSMTGRAVLA